MLRKQVEKRPNRYIGRYDFLPRPVELALTSLIEKEIDLQLRMEHTKRELERRPDFSTIDAFNAIDDYGFRFIDHANVQRFLRRYGFAANSADLVAIIRRLDLNAD